MRPAKEEKNLAAFGKRVAELRRAHGYTQEALAEKIDMTPHSLAFIEQGRRWPRLTTLHRIAKGIGVSTDELLKGLKG
jgi:transcriptional regulator with XRE-family HTH domain